MGSGARRSSCISKSKGSSMRVSFGFGSCRFRKLNRVREEKSAKGTDVFCWRENPLFHTRSSWSKWRPGFDCKNELR